MKKIEIVYTSYAARELHSGNVPQELEMIIGLPYRIQRMCIGEGKSWDRECPRKLKGVLDKSVRIKSFYKATRLLAVVTLNPMFVATITLRFFENQNLEKSFYEVTINWSRSGKTMVGEIRTTQQLYQLIT